MKAIDSLARLGRGILGRLERRRLDGVAPADLFGQVYASGQWGGGPGHDYYSGSGSHHQEIVSPYIDTIRRFAAGFTPPLDAVDLGCGDFNVGAQLRDGFAGYIAADVVPGLIEHNKRRFADLDVDFACVDLVEDPLPQGDVAMIRQVLQHLSNDQIAAIVPKLARFRYLIVTEHLPGEQGFTPNRDQPMSAGLRVVGGLGREKSGIVLTAPPFSLKVKSERVLCEVDDPTLPGTIIRTILYEPA